MIAMTKERGAELAIVVAESAQTEGKMVGTSRT